MPRQLFELTPLAQEDLKEITDYLVQTAGPAVAHALLNQLQQQFVLLGLFPQMSPRRPWLPRCVRLAVHHPYLIAYRDKPKPVRILRVLHGARDVNNLLSESA